MAHELSGISDKIPEDARKAFATLSGEVIWLREKWLNYKYLFGHSPKRIDLLNQSGGAIFYIINHLFHDDFILAFSRLTDPANGKTGNLSLEHLLVAVEPSAHGSLLASLRHKFELLRAKIENLRKHRNKRVAHADYRSSIGASDELPPVSRQLIEEALIEVEAFLREFDFYFSGLQMRHDMLKIRNGADMLHVRLLKARAYDALEKKGSIPKNTWRTYNDED